MSDEITQKDIDNFITSRPHVFILGAGASRAALPDGDANGLQSPVMAGFLKEANLENIISGIPLKTRSNNLEDIYSEIHASKKYPDVLKKLEQGISTYFRQFVLPFQPTIYDYLLLSLRSKDYIFTFNWDDLLVQACYRASGITRNLPKIYFLHGNVSMAFCDHCEQLYHYSDKACPQCGHTLRPQSLLYPVKQKDYEKDKSIANAWHDFLIVLKNCSLLTIFGYGAPPSDSAAIEKMKIAFSSTFRRFDSVEIIDIKDENTLMNEWNDFLRPTNYHVEFPSDFFHSIVARFPRRSVEGYHLTNFSGFWGDSDLKLKQFSSRWELADWLQPLLDNEEKGDFSVITNR